MNETNVKSPNSVKYMKRRQDKKKRKGMRKTINNKKTSLVRINKKNK